MTISAIFNEDYFRQIRLLDFSKSAQTADSATWFTHSLRELTSFQVGISRLIDKYATFLESETLETLEGLIHSVLVESLISICKADLPNLDKSHNWKRTYNVLNSYRTNGVPSQDAEEHINKLLSFLEFYNSVAPNPIHLSDLSLWSDNSAPAFGSGKLDESVT